MSTEYKTDPPIRYEDFIKTQCVDILTPPKVIYTTEHKLTHYKGTYIYVYKNEQGNVEFERFGINREQNYFPQIIKEFNVRIIDEYGIEFIKE